MNLLAFSDASSFEAETPEIDDVRGVTEDVWASLLGDEEILLPRAVPPGTPFDKDDVWSSAVTISGAWQGAVTLEVDADAARRLTSQMLGIPSPEDAEESDVADAVGELVNMIGGNVKGMMPGPSTLSLPAVAAGRAAFSSDMHEACRLDLSWRGAPVRVCVHVPVASDE